MDTLNELKEKIHSLETERARLSNEIESLRRAAEARAVSLEEDVNQMREEAFVLRGILNSKGGEGSPVSVSKPAASVPIAPVVESEPTPVSKVTAPELNPVGQELIYDDILKGLNDEERKVVEVLLNHGGRYPQKNLRADAGLSWLQANRILSHLSERGIVTFERAGGLIEVMLKESPS